MDFWKEFISFYSENRDLIMIISSSGAGYIIKEHIFDCCRLESADENEAYRRAAVAGMLCGLVDEWIKRGMGDFPQSFRMQE